MGACRTFAASATALAVSGGLSLLVACENDNRAEPTPIDDAGDAGCVLEFDGSRIDLCFDASFDAFVPGTGSGGDSTSYLRIEEITGDCVGKATGLGDTPTCTLDPTDYKATVNMEIPANTRPAGFILYTPQAVAAGPYQGSVAAFVRHTQPETSGKKTCNSIESACNTFKGTDKVDSFLLQAKNIGGTGKLTTIQFSVATLHRPSACSGDEFFPAGDDDTARVKFTPTPTISALESGPITLTGTQTFALDPGNLKGTVTCSYTVKLRPSDPSGN